MKTTKFAAIVVSACLLMSEMTGAASAAGKKEPISVWIGSQQVAFDVAPVIVKGVTYVELKGLFKALGYQMTYDAAGKIIKGTSPSGAVITLNASTGQATANGKPAAQAAKPIITKGRTLVPVRFAAEAAGYSVKWDAIAQMIVLAAKPSVIATYAGGQVTEDEFRHYIAFFSMLNPTFQQNAADPTARAQYLNEYIAFKVLYSRTSEEDRKNADKDADAFLEQYNQALAYDPQLKAMAEQAGLTADDARQLYHRAIAVRNYWESTVTDAELKAEYEKNADSYAIVSVRHILIATTDPSTGETKRTDAEALQLASEVKQKLAAGGDWSELAKQYSEDPGSRDNGGLYENAMPIYWIEEFKQAAIKQPIGVVGEPFRTSYGYHVMQVVSREVRKYEEIDDEIKGMLHTNIVNAKYDNFMTNELPALIKSTTLPKSN